MTVRSGLFFDLGGSRLNVDHFVGIVQVDADVPLTVEIVNPSPRLCVGDNLEIASPIVANFEYERLAGERDGGQREQCEKNLFHLEPHRIAYQLHFSTKIVQF